MLVIKNKIYYINVSLTVVGEDVGVLEGVDDWVYVKYTRQSDKWMISTVYRTYMVSGKYHIDQTLKASLKTYLWIIYLIEIEITNTFSYKEGIVFDFKTFQTPQ